VPWQVVSRQCITKYKRQLKAHLDGTGPKLTPEQIDFFMKRISAYAQTLVPAARRSLEAEMTQYSLGRVEQNIIAHQTERFNSTDNQLKLLVDGQKRIEENQQKLQQKMTTTRQVNPM